MGIWHRATSQRAAAGNAAPQRASAASTSRSRRRIAIPTGPRGLAPEVRSRIALLTLCAFTYLYVYPYFPKINNPNENVRLYMTAAIVEDGTYAIDRMRTRWGWVNDAAVFDGHIYSVKAPGTSLLGIPAYAASLYLSKDFDRDQALWWCRVWSSILPALAFLFLLHHHLHGLTRDPLLRDSVFITVAIGSVLYGYSLLFVSHTTSAGCAFAAYHLLRAAPRPSSRPPARPLLAGLAAACVTLFEYPGLLASLGLTLYAGYQYRKQPRAILYYGLGALPPTLLVMHFQYCAFDNPFMPGHLFVESDAFRAAHHEGIYGAVGPNWNAFYGLLFAPGAGLFPLCPLLSLALPGAIVAARTRGERAALLCNFGLCCSTLLAIASMNNWRGGWTIGPRYLALLIPFLAVLALRGLDRLANRLPTTARALALSGAIMGIWSSGTLSAYYPHLPTRLNRPLAQLIPVLWNWDFAPYNAAGALNLYGSTTMIPLLVAAALMVLLATSWQRGWYSLLAATPLYALGIWLTLSNVHTPLKARYDVNLVTRTWTPNGHDFPTKARIRWHERREKPNAEELRAVIHAYRAMQRGPEARALTRYLNAIKD